jgi:hypothetical protein
VPAFVGHQSALESDGSKGLNVKDRREKRQQEFLRQHTDECGNIRQDLWLEGIEHVKRMKIGAGVPRARSGAAQRTGVRGVQWTQIGPAPLVTNSPITSYAGLVTDIAIDPRNTTDETIYIATDGGGIWKSTDRGKSWKPKTDFMPSLSMGAVTLDPSNPSIVYAGTGFGSTKLSLTAPAPFLLRLSASTGRSMPARRGLFSIPEASSMASALTES